MTADHVDQLRRAALVMRGHDESATPAPWLVEQFDVEGSDYMTWQALSPAGMHGQRTVAVEAVTADAGYCSQAEADVTCAAVLRAAAGPLAVLFDRAAAAMDSIDDVKRAGRLTEAHLAHLADLMEVVRLARAVLREEVQR